jgi:CelD/BcsL family acetyltransferase involved in cellulose biosynthesis
MHVQVLNAPSAFDELQDEWLHLLTQMPFQSIFFTPQWQAVWWRYFGGGHQLHLVTERSASGELQGLAPLMMTAETSSLPRHWLIALHTMWRPWMPTWKLFLPCTA